jgi:EAL domain-containing protein (putative c-di-GMP-specific phosphodiesterase class I)
MKQPNLMKIINKNILASYLYHAVQENQLEIHYQPQIKLSTGNIIGVEALLRWNHPVLGNISPIEFVPILEEINLINNVTKWMLSRACIKIKELSSFLNQPLKLSINLSANQLIADYLPQTINDILTKVDFPPHLLTLELVETSLIKDFDKAKQIIDKLKNLGISIAIDDFGAGYSSLTYLREFVCDIVKIDKSFITNLNQYSRKKTLVKGIIEICKNMNIEVVAEGIENETEFEFLRHNKCEYGQGYLISKPLSIDQLNHFMFKYTENNQEKKSYLLQDNNHQNKQTKYINNANIESVNFQAIQSLTI